MCAIVFVGSVFSPYYARERRRRDGDAEARQHCAINLALYRRRGGAWVLSETPGHLGRGGSELNIGASRAAWHHGELILDICERSAPWGTPVRGQVRLRPGPGLHAPQPLHAVRPHWWWPVAPCARVDVQLNVPGGHWQGRGYHDVNWGHEPLSRGFEGWSWQRLWHAEGTLVQYMTRPVTGPVQHLGQLYRADGTMQRMPALAPHPLPKTGWGIARLAAGAAREIHRREDTPFYSRSTIAVDTGGETLFGMHEQLDMARFDAAWVQFLLRFRMRRRA